VIELAPLERLLDERMSEREELHVFVVERIRARERGDVLRGTASRTGSAVDADEMRSLIV